MVLKLYGSHGSTCSRRVKVVMEELGLDYEVIALNFAVAEHKSEPYLEKQPFGQIPVLDDDGFLIYESRAIGYYLARKYYGKAKANLIPDPEDIKATALFHQALSVEVSNFDPSAAGIGYEKVFAAMKGGTTDEARLEKHVETLKMKLQGYERILSKQKYIAGNELTVVDLFHLPYGQMTEQFFPEILESQPHVAKWWKELKGRESWAKANTKPSEK